MEDLMKFMLCIVLLGVGLLAFSTLLAGGYIMY